VIEEPMAGVAPAAETDVDAGEATPALEAAEPVGPAPTVEATEKSPWDDPRLPWTGKPGKADIACWAAVVGSGLFLLILLPFRAALVGTHPVIGELLNGSTESVISAAAFARTGHGSLAVAILAAFPGMMKFDLVWWWAGSLWGEKLILLISGRRSHGPKYMARVRKWGRRFTWPAVVVSPFLPIPNTIVYAVAGWAGMRLVTFIVLDFIGTALWVGLLISLGWELGHHAVVVAQTISKYSLWISVGIVVIVLAGQFWGGRRKGQTPPGTLP
jgi:membrane protein DedA with SNARE-associated domain